MDELQSIMCRRAFKQEKDLLKTILCLKGAECHDAGVKALTSLH